MDRSSPPPFRPFAVSPPDSLDLSPPLAPLTILEKVWSYLPFFDRKRNRFDSALTHWKSTGPSAEASLQRADRVLATRSAREDRKGAGPGSPPFLDIRAAPGASIHNGCLAPCNRSGGNSPHRAPGGHSCGAGKPPREPWIRSPLADRADIRRG